MSGANPLQSNFSFRTVIWIQVQLASAIRLRIPETKAKKMQFGTVEIRFQNNGDAHLNILLGSIVQDNADSIPPLT